MNVLYIEGRRNGYDPDQCGKTMTVSELINFLREFDGDLYVYLNNDNGYTFGNITEGSFTEGIYIDSDADAEYEVPTDEVDFDEV